MGFFDLFSGDDNGDNPFKPMLDALKKSSKSEGADKGGDNPLAMLFQVLMMFLKQVLGGGMEKSAPKYDDGDQPGTEAERKAMETRVKEEEKTLPKFSDSVKNLTPSAITQIPQRLSEIKNEPRGEDGKLLAIMPIVGGGRVTSKFGHRDPVMKKDGTPLKDSNPPHDGLDIASPTSGAKVELLAPVSGVVLGVGNISGYGITVEILDADGTRHRLAHIAKDSVKVKQGDQVKQGEEIATMGDTGRVTGVHVHYEQIGKDGKAHNPIINGRTWSEGQSFTQAETVAFLNAHGGGSDVILADTRKPGIDGQLAQVDLTSIQQQQQPLHLPEYTLPAALVAAAKGPASAKGGPG